MIENDAKAAQGVISLIPGIGTGISAAISVGIGILEGGGALDVAIEAAYGAIPIPAGIRQITDAVLGAVLQLIHHPHNLTDALLAGARNAVPAGMPRDVFDTLANLIFKHMPVTKAAGQLVDSYVQRYAPGVADPRNRLGGRIGGRRRHAPSERCRCGDWRRWGHGEEGPAGRSRGGDCGCGARRGRRRAEEERGLGRERRGRRCGPEDGARGAWRGTLCCSAYRGRGRPGEERRRSRRRRRGERGSKGRAGCAWRGARRGSADCGRGRAGEERRRGHRRRRRRCSAEGRSRCAGRRARGSGAHRGGAGAGKNAFAAAGDVAGKIAPGVVGQGLAGLANVAGAASSGKNPLLAASPLIVKYLPGGASPARGPAGAIPFPSSLAAAARLLPAGASAPLMLPPGPSGAVGTALSVASGVAGAAAHGGSPLAALGEVAKGLAPGALGAVANAPTQAAAGAPDTAAAGSVDLTAAGSLASSLAALVRS